MGYARGRVRTGEPLSTEEQRRLADERSLVRYVYHLAFVVEHVYFAPHQQPQERGRLTRAYHHLIRRQNMERDELHLRRVERVRLRSPPLVNICRTASVDMNVRSLGQGR